MRRRSRRRSMRPSALLTGLIAIACAVSVVRFLYAAGVGSALDSAVRSMAENEVITDAVLKEELGRSYSIQKLASDALSSQSSLLGADGLDGKATAAASQADTPSEAQTAGTDVSVQYPEPALSTSAGESPLPDTPYRLAEPETTLEPSVDAQPENEPEEQTDSVAFHTEDTRFTQEDADGIVIRNETSYTPIVYDLLQEPLDLTLSPDEPSILIIHTHGTESYTPEGARNYEGEGYRTTDTDYSVVRVGDEIARVLTENGINVIHDTGIYDSPSYSGSYTRTLAVIEDYLEKYPTITAVLDVHRDSSVDDEGGAVKTTALIDGMECSQVMLVIGTDDGGMNHPDYVSNLKLGLRLQAVMNRNYPGLARPVNLRQERFNQHATSGSLIAEIGFAGNTLSEALNAARLFAQCYVSAINGS